MRRTSARSARINYRSEDFVEVVKQLTAGKGRGCNPGHGGRRLRAARTEMPGHRRTALVHRIPRRESRLRSTCRDILVRRLTITGSTLRPRTVEFKAAIAKALRDKVWPLIDAGKIRPVIYKVVSAGPRRQHTS